MTPDRGRRLPRSTDNRARPKDRLGDAERQMFGERLRTLRGTTTQQRLGELARLAPSSISELEAGEHDPTLGTLLRLQRALHLKSIEEFLGPLPSPGEMPSAHPRWGENPPEESEVQAS